jgi:hypothetical protein
MNKQSMLKGPKPPSAIVTFPIHVTRDVWDRFKDALEPGQSAHGVLVEFIEKHGSRKGKGQLKQTK